MKQTDAQTDEDNGTSTLRDAEGTTGAELKLASRNLSSMKHQSREEGKKGGATTIDPELLEENR